MQVIARRSHAACHSFFTVRRATCDCARRSTALVLTRTSRTQSRFSGMPLFESRGRPERTAIASLACFSRCAMLRESLRSTGITRPCGSIVRHTRRKMNSGFALTLGTWRGYATRDCNALGIRNSGGSLAYHRPSFSNSPRVPGLYNSPAFLLIALALPAFGAAKKVIIDTDPGTDDAMALMLALNSPELDVRAVTVVPATSPPSRDWKMPCA